MKKVYSIFIMTILVAVPCAKASAMTVEEHIVFDDEVSVSCDGLFTEEALDIISDILNWIRILAPAALIVFTAVDFGSAILSQDNDSIKKASSKVLKRAIATIVLFFVPTIIRVILNLPGVRDVIQIPSDPLCGTMNSQPVENELLIK